MNDIIKVYGHPRSGNNFLLATMYVNFYKDMDIKVGAPLGAFIDENGIEWKGNKYKVLFGNHLVNINDAPITRAIYIKRNPLDTAYSIYIFQKSRNKLPRPVRNMTFPEYLKAEIQWAYFGRRRWKFAIGKTILEAIRTHHRIWESSGIYVVEYEDLKEHPHQTIRGIARHFNLHFVPPIQVIDHLVGWTPNKGRIGEGRKAYLEAL